MKTLSMPFEEMVRGGRVTIFMGTYGLNCFEYDIAICIDKRLCVRGGVVQLNDNFSELMLERNDNVFLTKKDIQDVNNWVTDLIVTYETKNGVPYC